MKIGSHTKNLKVIVISALMILTLPGVAAAGGLFGPPQPISREEGGLHTGIGYWLHEDKFKNETEYVIRQNQIYSQVGYGAKYWEIYARIGVSDLKVPDAFSSTNALTTTAKNDFEENWKFSGTLGAKGFYPINKIFGIGAFIQGTYIYSDFTDDVSGTQNGTPYTVELKVKNLWDVNLGIGFQATVPYGVKMYIGPYLYYSEAKASQPANISGLKFTGGDVTIKNKTNIGGYTGVDVPLAKGLRLNVEGQYSERLSAGCAVTYTY
jgi:hypothetical protein